MSSLLPPLCLFASRHSTLCDPYLNLFRGIIPPLGGTLDFSPILAFVLLSVSSTAQAHPAQRRCCDVHCVLPPLLLRACVSWARAALACGRPC